MITARGLSRRFGPRIAVDDVTLEVAQGEIVVISSRVNDPRTAQQFGVALGLFGVWILLTLFSVALFEREAILTRWR